MGDPPNPAMRQRRRAAMPRAAHAALALALALALSATDVSGATVGTLSKSIAANAARRPTCP